MKLIDLNRDGGIGANSLLLRLGRFRLLVDCGLNPRREALDALPEMKPLLEGGELDAVLLTHCHLDHLGSLPVVLRHQPRPPVLMSIPSTHLAARMLHNSVNVMKREREEKGIDAYPLFTHGEVDRAEPRFHAMAYGQPRRLGRDGEELEVTFFGAGHVAGAAGIRLVHRKRRIFLTGDVLFADLETLPGARFPDETCDTLVMETTRGATGRATGRSRVEETGRFLGTVGRTLERGGSVLVPVFALGRMQEVLTMLVRARREGLIPETPVFCGGLGLDLCNHFDEIARRTGLVKFSRQILKTLQVHPAPRQIEPGRAPKKGGLYILSSGMLVEHTPSYRMAAALLGGEANAVCFVGYCDPDTPGGRLLATPPGEMFRFDVLQFQARRLAHVERFDISGHADREELLRFAVARRPRSIVLTHGDPGARKWFSSTLAAAMPEAKVLDPEPLRTHEV